MINNKKGKYYDFQHNRLVYISEDATPEMWHKRWQIGEDNLQIRLAKRNNKIVDITANFMEPKDGILLEGGCGYGSKVNSLEQAGYKVIGIDNDKNTVALLNKVSPHLDIRFGDVRKLRLNNNSVAGYWSIGVIEHFYEGYYGIAREMHRVLKKGGYLFLAFPYMSPLRKAKVRLGLYPTYKCGAKPEGFYQFALDHKSVLRVFRSMGFELCLFDRDKGLLGFVDEIRFKADWAHKTPLRDHHRLVECIRYTGNKIFSSFSSHSCLMVFKLLEKGKW